FLILAYLAAGIQFLLRYRADESRIAANLFAGALISAASEYLFTLYGDVTDLYNIAGHLLKVLAYGFFYRGVFIHHVREPHARLSETLGELSAIFDNALIGITVMRNRTIQRVNPALASMLGLPPNELVGRDISDFYTSPREFETALADIRESFRQHGRYNGEQRYRRHDGSSIWCRLAGRPLLEHHRQAGQVWLIEDITALKESQRRLEHMAHHDALTQLPNRTLLADRLQRAIARARRESSLLAVCYLDLDDFKPVNDRFGHAAGDQLLIEVTQRLRSCLRDSDTLSRLGGDEFVMLLGGICSTEEYEIILRRVFASLNTPFTVAGESLRITASIGVTLFPADDADTDTLLRHADQAMYTAKQAGRNRYHQFDTEDDRRHRDHHEALTRLEAALARNEFVLYYQPAVNMRHGHVVGVEALIRWQHPVRGLLLPEDFLSVAENSFLSVTLGEWVLAKVAEQAMDWASAGLALPVSVNLFARHLEHPAFVERLRTLLTDNPSLATGWLRLELLETAAINDLTGIAATIEECRRMGVEFALDDFGTGYSPLTYLKIIPAQTVKIDRSFVRDMLEDPSDLAIVESVIGLAAAFRRQVVAEGVETLRHGTRLLQLGCDCAQGYGIAPPMTAGEIAGWVRRYRLPAEWATQPGAQRRIELIQPE
ncbi:MAG: EAL domain-containing protein, partial [Gammaproteobacteria bacterium]|nr:EAL domain-containing protein [Gammaproteobacteria bacterium]